MVKNDSEHGVHTKFEIARYERRSDRIAAKILRRYPAFTTDMVNAGQPEAAPVSQEDLAATWTDGNDRPNFGSESHQRHVRPEIRSVARTLVEAERSGLSGSAVRYYDHLHKLVGEVGLELLAHSWPTQFYALTGVRAHSPEGKAVSRVVAQRCGFATRVEVERKKREYAEGGFEKGDICADDPEYEPYAKELQIFQQAVLDEVARGEEEFAAGVKENAVLLQCSEPTAEEIVYINVDLDHCEEDIQELKRQIELLKG